MQFTYLDIIISNKMQQVLLRLVIRFSNLRDVNHMMKASDKIPNLRDVNHMTEASDKIS